MKKLLCLILALTVLLGMTALASPIQIITKGDPAASFPEDAKLLTIRFMDTSAASDCFLLTYDGMTMLIDCATANEALKFLVPHVKELGVTSIDCVVNTHPHDDHIDGFTHFADNFPIGAFYTSFPLNVNGEQRRAVAKAKEKEIPIVSLEDQDSIVFSDLEIRTYADADKHAYNNASLIMHIRFGDSALLLLADTEITAEKDVNLLWKESAKCDIVKMPHHGLNNPSFSLMQNALPKLAVISGRRTSKTGKALTTLHNVHCANALFTVNGDIVCVTDGTRWVVRQEPDMISQ